MNPQLQQRFRFFLEHAGYATPPGRAACALALARAEHVARDIADATFEWKDDFDQPIQDLLDPSIFRSEEEFKTYCDRYRDDVTGCVLRDANGEVRASLWGIIGADSSYRRIIEAELALEAYGREYRL
jgi:hypothetical protein